MRRQARRQTKRKIKILTRDFIGIVILVALDQLTKYLAIACLKDKPAFKIINGVLELNYLENRGAAFGMLQNQRIFVIFVTVIILGVIIYILCKSPNGRKYTLMHILLSLISAGAVGNMIDRIRLDYVVDFIYITLINFPIFNVADMYVTFATVILILALLFYYKENDLLFIGFEQKKFRELD